MNAWPSDFKRAIELEHTLFERQIKNFIHDFFDQASVETQAFQILNSLDEGLIIFDLQGKPVLFNPSALRILNVSEEQLLAYNLLNDDLPVKYFETGEICPPSEYAGRKALLEGKSYFKQVLGREIAGGKRVWISQNAVPLFQLGKSVWHGVILTFRDISENIEQLQELRIREKSLMEAQRIARLGFWEWDLSSNRLNWSPEIYRIFGRSPETFEATYPNFLLTLPESDRTMLENAVQQAFDDHLPYSVEHRLIMPSGEIRYVHEQAEVWRDAFGKPLKMLGVVRDITESTLSQLSLSAQQARLELALESSDLGILEWDLYTDRVYIDTRMEEIFACSQASIINFADFEALFQSEQKSILFFHMNQLLESQSPFEIELWLEQPEREKKCVRVRGKSLLNEQSQSYRIIAVFLDITQHKLAEKNLKNKFICARSIWKPRSKKKTDACKNCAVSMPLHSAYMIGPIRQIWSGTSLIYWKWDLVSPEIGVLSLKCRKIMLFVIVFMNLFL